MPCTVLVLESGVDGRDQIFSALSDMRLHAVVPSSADEGVAWLRGLEAALAIVSYEGDGFGLPLAVRLKAAGPASANCIVVADQVCPALGQAAKDLGLLAILKRPVTPAALARAVETHVLGLMETTELASPRRAFQ